jgi:putative ATP-dependent endonuclease of OLD family
MTVIRIVEINGFRGIKSLRWAPNPGVNALIGPGDSCKSTILDAIDWCLGTRRAVPISYADFHKMDTSSPIRIMMTIGELPDELLSIRKFGECLKGFRAGSTELESEPSNGLEDVIQVTLKIERDLEPQWFIVKEAGDDDDVFRFSWDARQHVAPVRIGASAAHHLSWRRGSALSKITEDDVSAHDVLSAALQSARTAFSSSPPGELDAALKFATKCCNDFAVANVQSIKAGFDIDAVFAGDNSIALHDHEGVPLRRLGVGSVRLLSLTVSFACSMRLGPRRLQRKSKFF